MSLAIEQLIKLHDAQAVSIESFGAGRGRGMISKEQVIAAFAEAERRCQTGFDILLAKHRQDGKAEVRLRQVTMLQAQRSGFPLSSDAALISISLTLHRILPSQQPHIASLLRRHHRRAQQARRLIDACNDTIRGMIRRGGDPEYIKMQKARADEIRNGLREWSEREAMSATTCPRCSGTGSAKAGSACQECGGGGLVVTTDNDIWRAMKAAGATRKDFDEVYQPLIKSLCCWLSAKESEASDIMSKRISAEIRGAA